MNKRNTIQKPGIISSLDFKKNVRYIIQIVTNKMFETRVIQKIIADLGTIQYPILNYDLIGDHYNDYIDPQTRS